MINQKGGCGKSSSCFHLAGALARSGQNVLLVDVDPQGSLSQGFLGPAVVESLPATKTVASLYDEASFFQDRSELIQATHVDGISLCPANQSLAPFNMPSPELSGATQFAMREFLEEQTGFDVILIDCPPNLYACSWTAMVAADYVIIPVPPEDFGTQGLRAVHQAIDNARQLNPGLRRLGHLVTRFDSRLIIHREYRDRLIKLYPELVLETVIPEASAFKVSVACRMPVEFYSPRSRAAELTRALGQELLARISLRTETATNCMGVW